MKSQQAKRNYVIAEIKRLTQAGIAISKIAKLLDILHTLRDRGNTVVVIEHNLDVIKTADWIVDLGPEGGSGGGEIIAEGTPEDVAQNARSHTGRFLKPMLKV